MPVIRSTHSRRLIDVIGEDHFDNQVERGSDADIKEYRIPIHNRYPQWSSNKSEILVDSIMSNYPIHAFITSEHYDIMNSTNYKHIEDGQTRLSVLQDYIKDKYTWQGQKYSELSPDQRSFFDYYEIRVENVSKPPKMSTDDFNRELHEIFARLNSGKPLTNNDKYHLNRPYAPTLQLLDEVLNDPRYRDNFTRFIGPVGQGKGRRLLSEMVGMILPLTRRDESRTECINTSYERNSRFIYETIDEEGRQNLFAFLDFYFNILTDALASVSRVKKTYGKLTGVLGLLVYSWIVDRENTSIMHYDTWRSFIVSSLQKTFIDQIYANLRQGERRNLTGDSIAIRRNTVLEYYQQPIIQIIPVNTILNISPDHSESESDDE
jgi:hypothetical protein